MGKVASIQVFATQWFSGQVNYIKNLKMYRQKCIIQDPHTVKTVNDESTMKLKPYFLCRPCYLNGMSEDFIESPMLTVLNHSEEE